MKTEHKELTLCVPDQQNGGTSATFHVLRMLDDKGEEKTWEMRSFMDDLFPPLLFKTEEEYQAYVKEWSWMFIFPEWDEAVTPGVGVKLTTLSDELGSNEIHQWLYDVLFEMRSHLEGFEVAEKVQIETGLSDPDDLKPLPQLTVGILLNKPRQTLDILYVPEMPDFTDLEDGIKKTMLAYMSSGRDPIPYVITMPVIWNVTQNKPNVFCRGDICKVRFVNCSGEIKINKHPEWMTSWESMPFNEIWNQWP